MENCKTTIYDCKDLFIDISVEALCSLLDKLKGSGLDEESFAKKMISENPGDVINVNFKTKRKVA